MHLRSQNGSRGRCWTKKAFYSSMKEGKKGFVGRWTWQNHTKVWEVSWFFWENIWASHTQTTYSPRGTKKCCLACSSLTALDPHSEGAFVCSLHGPWSHGAIAVLWFMMSGRKSLLLCLSLCLSVSVSLICWNICWCACMLSGSGAQLLVATAAAWPWPHWSYLHPPRDSPMFQP